MEKNSIERMCRAAGLRPERRERIRDQEVFIADGFSLMPHNAWRRFGVDEDEFKRGMFVTLWWLSKDEKLDVGQPLFFAVDHNPELDVHSKKQARINAAIKTADKFLTARKKVQGKPH